MKHCKPPSDSIAQLHAHAVVVVLASTHHGQDDTHWARVDAQYISLMQSHMHVVLCIEMSNRDQRVCDLLQRTHSVLSRELLRTSPV